MTNPVLREALQHLVEQEDRYFTRGCPQCLGGNDERTVMWHTAWHAGRKHVADELSRIIASSLDSPGLDFVASVNGALHTVHSKWRIEKDDTGQAKAVPTPECYSNFTSQDSPQPVAALRLDAVVTAFESLQSMGIHLHGKSGEPLDKQQFIDAVLAAGRAALDSPTEPSIDLTNHHNAMTCPYCNPNKWKLFGPDDSPAELTTKRETDMIPTVGRIVLYKLGEQDAAEINRRRTTGASIAARIKVEVKTAGDVGNVPQWPLGAQAHIGNEAKAGDVFPMLICRTWGSTAESAVNGQVFLDGNDIYWATSCVCGDNLGNWQWPTIQK